MPQKECKLILFDLGNVLLNFDHRRSVKEILKFTGKSFEEVYQLFFDSVPTRAFEAGRLSPEDFFSEMSRILELKDLSFKEFVFLWNDIFFENDGIVDLLKALKKRYTLHLISNINQLHYAYIESRYPDHLALFDRRTLSFKVGCSKPDPIIYRRAVEEGGFVFEETLYTDDRQDLIDGAGRLGLKGVLFKGVENFKTQLQALNIYPSCHPSS